LFVVAAPAASTNAASTNAAAEQPAGAGPLSPVGEGWRADLPPA